MYYWSSPHSRYDRCAFKNYNIFLYLVKQLNSSVILLNILDHVTQIYSKIIKSLRLASQLMLCTSTWQQVPPAEFFYGLSRRYDGSHHHERWVLLCENSPILDWHIRPQVEHRKVPDSGGSVLRSCRFATRWSTRFTSKRCTALRHVVRQVVLSLARLSRSDGIISHCLRVSFRRSL